MNMRTEEQIRAYIDGYNDCFEQFCNCLKGECLTGRKSVMDAIRKMRMYKDAVNNVVGERLEG